MKSASKRSCSNATFLEMNESTKMKSHRSKSQADTNEAVSFLPFEMQQEGNNNPRPKLKKSQSIFKIISKAIKNAVDNDITQTQKNIAEDHFQEEEKDTNKDAATVEGGICLISDSPTYIFKLADQGNVKQISALCNVDPDRIRSTDRKGANILHHAAAFSKINVLDYVLSTPEGAELLSMKDDHEATPLHWAVEKDATKSVEYLVQKGADPTIGNNHGYSALHLAVQKNSLSSLKVLLRSKVDKNYKGASGLTPLHVAAYIDNEEAFKILLDAGAKPCQACSQGYRPLHTAAVSGSRKVMQLLLEHGEKYGYTRERLLSFGDKEMSSPLHCAVTGGNMCAIKVCLEYGARLDVRQADDSTPMHMVCGQGNLDIVKLMFEQAPEQARATLFLLDKCDHSPLHKAAMYNHPNIIKYLVSKDADMEIVDTDQRTPLLLATTRESWESVRTLIELGANWLVKDKDERNMMHTLVLKGANLGYLSSSGDCRQACFKKDEIESLVSKADAFGCTPLHYACQEGNLSSLRCLMSMGVSARLKSWKNQSALHFASMYGRFNACTKLLNSEQGPNIINEKDECGMTPLHFAAMNGHVKVVQMLMNRGAIIHRNSCGETPLHVAASNGYTKTIRVLVEMHCQLIDQAEENGNTALHHAARAGQVTAVELLLDLNASFLRNKAGSTCFTEAIVNQNQEVAMCIVQHDRWEEAMRAFQKVKEAITPPILLLIQYLPDVCVSVLNKCKETSDLDARSPDYWIRYHFKYLQPPVNVRTELKKMIRDAQKGSIKQSRKSKKEKKEKEEEEEEHSHQPVPGITQVALPALNTMVDFNRVQCLRHPVSVAYLKQKWQSYGRFIHGFNLFFFMMSLFPITYIVSFVSSKCHFENYSNVTVIPNCTTEMAGPDHYTTFEKVMMVQLAVVNILQMMKEVVQMYQQKLSYFFDFTNYIEWTLYLCSVLYVIPFLTYYPVHWQFEVGAVAVFLAWFNLLVFLQKFDIAGIYVVMFMHILKTLVQVILVFFFLIIAFALAFTVLMQNEADKAFSTPSLSILRVSTMFLGEISYVEKFLDPYVDDDPTTNHFGIPAFILLLAFILMMPILLMNLLIGLAVGDIAEVQSNAVLQRLAMQVFKYTGVQEDYGGNGEPSKDPYIDYIQSELLKQKNRIKKMQSTLDKQHDLLRLIVQKMEIRSEADNQDEGSIHRPDEKPRKSLSALTKTTSSKLLALQAFKSRKL